MNFSVFFFLLLPSTNSLGVTVVNLVYNYLTRGIEDPDGNPLEIGGAGGAIYLHTWYYTTLLGQHRRE